jgi:hypothetical protein
LTCWPTFTSTFESVPLVLKLASTSVPGSMLPLPETVDCTTPFSAVTISREVRPELVGGPISSTAATTTTAPNRPSRTRCQIPRVRDFMSAQGSACERDFSSAAECGRFG